MLTRIIEINREEINKELMGEAAQVILEGGLVAFPTETVYGLAANGLDERAIKKIFEAKGRPQDNPLILHVASIEQVNELVEDIPELAKISMERFWPGPLTILFKKSTKVTDIVTAGLDTVAIRMPKHEIALELIRRAGIPLAAPSANISGRPSPTRSGDVIEDLMGKVDMIIDGGNTGLGLESTVLDLSGDRPLILRPGGITLEDLQEIMPDIEEDLGPIDEKGSIRPKSPGQKYKHYAPRAEMLVYTGEIDRIIKNIMERASDYKKQGKKVGILCSDETRKAYEGLEGVLLISLGSRKVYESIGQNLFASLRLLDRKEVDLILAEGVDYSKLGSAIMNRMAKAASGQVIKV